MDKISVILQTTNEFLEKLGFSKQVSVEVTEEDDHFKITLKTDDPALLIGYHGNTLSGLQLFLGQHLHKQFDEWINIAVDVNDYRQRREQSLKTLADTTVEQVLAGKQAYILPPMTASERRVIHVYLAEHPQVTTASSGEGRDRSVIISPKV